MADADTVTQEAVDTSDPLTQVAGAGNPDPLSQLADIHLPDPISWWPLAPGWWVLIAALAVLAFLLTRRVAAQMLQRRIRRHALGELDKALAAYRTASAVSGADPQVTKLNYVNEINAVLRRVALKHYPQQNPASLSGKRWVTFLRNHGDSTLLSEPLADTLSEGRFARQWDVDENALYQMAQRWISSLYLARIEPITAPDDTSTSTAVSKHA